METLLLRYESLEFFSIWVLIIWFWKPRVNVQLNTFIDLQSLRKWRFAGSTFQIFWKNRKFSSESASREPDDGSRVPSDNRHLETRDIYSKPIFLLFCPKFDERSVLFQHASNAACYMMSLVLKKSRGKSFFPFNHYVSHLLEFIRILYQTFSHLIVEDTKIGFAYIDTMGRKSKIILYLCVFLRNYIVSSQIENVMHHTVETLFKDSPFKFTRFDNSSKYTNTTQNNSGRRFFSRTTERPIEPASAAISCSNIKRLGMWPGQIEEIETFRKLPVLKLLTNWKYVDTSFQKTFTGLSFVQGNFHCSLYNGINRDYNIGQDRSNCFGRSATWSLKHEPVLRAWTALFRTVWC